MKWSVIYIIVWEKPLIFFQSLNEGIRNIIFATMVRSRESQLLSKHKVEVVLYV